MTETDHPTMPNGYVLEMKRTSLHCRGCCRMSFVVVVTCPTLSHNSKSPHAAADHVQIGNDGGEWNESLTRPDFSSKKRNRGVSGAVACVVRSFVVVLFFIFSRRTSHKWGTIYTECCSPRNWKSSLLDSATVVKLRFFTFLLKERRSRQSVQLVSMCA